MLFPQQFDFYTRWLAKADESPAGDVSALVDRYISLFINYNSLYNLVPIKLAWLNDTPRQDVGDHEGATKSMIKFLGVQVIAEYLAAEQLELEVTELADVIENGPFNIKLRNGNPRPGADALLVRHLRSPVLKERVEALFETLYQIRCNIFHGEKALVERQVDLLQPSTRLLRAILVLSYRELQRLTV